MGYKVPKILLLYLKKRDFKTLKHTKMEILKMTNLNELPTRFGNLNDTLDLLQ